MTNALAQNDVHSIRAISPKLPSYDKITNYLREIDHNRWYCNFGPMTQLLENRLAQTLAVSSNAIITTASGTSALVSLLKAYFNDTSVKCLLPAWTFSATACAVQMTQLTPIFCDVNPITWALDIEQVRHQVELDPEIKCVLLVSPFGAPLPLAQWNEFSKETGVKIIVDAAGAFDAISKIPAKDYTDIPVVISLHATKTFGIGEGGLILAQESSLNNRLREVINFGFDEDKLSSSFGLNAKMSEYHAAVGLAVCDQWQTHIDAYRQVATWYQHELQALPVTVFNDETWVSSTFNIQLPEPNACACIDHFALSKIEARQWWRQGLHRQRAFANISYDNLANTDYLAKTVVGLPFYQDMSYEDVCTVAHKLKDFIIP